MLSRSEEKLFRQLQMVAPAMQVRCLVKLAQALYLAPMHHHTWAKLAAIGKKEIDYLLCRKSDSSIVMAVEVHRPTRDPEAQKIKNEMVRAALADTGIPVMFMALDDLPDVKALRRMIAPLILDRLRHEAQEPSRLSVI